MKFFKLKDKRSLIFIGLFAVIGSNLVEAQQQVCCNTPSGLYWVNSISNCWGENDFSSSSSCNINTPVYPY